MSPSFLRTTGLRAAVLALAAMLLSGCGYNTIQQKDEAVKAAWSEVLNQYKRRADLMPNLVATRAGYASHEREVLTAVTEARARVGSINVNADDPASLQQFQQAQGELQSAIGRLLVVTENYPKLKADQTFLRPAGAAGRHREPHHRGAPALHPGGAGLQHLHPVRSRRT